MRDNVLMKEEEIDSFVQAQRDATGEGDMERIYDLFELKLQSLVSEIIDDGYAPEDAAQFLKDYADKIK